MTEFVSPLRAPEPRHPQQAVLFTSPVDTTYAIDGQKMSVTITIRLGRTPRQKCSNCGNRRILFFVGLNQVIQSPPMCAKCAGIR